MKPPILKALTIYQPWATLIMGGAKPWEWRGWPAPNWLVGHRLVIHASARAVKREEVLDILRQMADGDSSLIETIAKPILETAHTGSYLLSCGLGTALVGQPINAFAWAKEHDKSGLDSDRIDHSKWAWPLTDIKPFAVPVPAKGMQGLWNWSGDRS